MLYKDRHDAGRQLAKKLLKYKDENPLILALPRGGVVVGYEIAKMLNAPLDVIVARKIGAPSQPELGIGAIAPNGIRILNGELIRTLGISESQIKEIIEKETMEMNRRTELYRGKLSPPDLFEKTVIIVDDGIATGISDKAAVLSLPQLEPQKIVLAVPVCPPDAVNKFGEVDEFICLAQPPDFYAVGAHYENFEQVSDEEVINLLQDAKKFINSN